MILPLIAPLFTKFYDSLSGFHCPPSYVLGAKKANEVFPQLDEKVKYCAVLHEGQHNDARAHGHAGRRGCYNIGCVTIECYN